MVDYINLSAMNVYIGLAINGIFTGLGAGIGTYLANKHVIERTNLIIKRLRDRLKK